MFVFGGDSYANKVSVSCIMPTPKLEPVLMYMLPELYENSESDSEVGDAMQLYVV